MGDGERPTPGWLLEARAIKHQMSNILMGLLGHTELLEEAADVDDKTRRRARVMRQELRRLQGEVDALNTLCRGDSPD